MAQSDPAIHDQEPPRVKALPSGYRRRGRPRSDAASQVAGWRAPSVHDAPFRKAMARSSPKASPLAQSALERPIGAKTPHSLAAGASVEHAQARSLAQSRPRALAWSLALAPRGVSVSALSLARE